LVYSAKAQKIEVSGTAIGQPGKLVRVIVYADQFSRLDSTLAEATTDAWGNFDLSFTCEQTDYAFLALGMKRGEFYLKPGNKYQMYIRKDSVKGSVFDQLPLQFELKEQGDTLNSLIENFNFDYNTFILQYQKQLLRAKPAGLINDFIKKENEKFKVSLSENTYFRHYVTYSLASLEWVSEVKSDTVILKDYFTGKGVLYENIAYTDLFRDFFKQYFKNIKEFDYPDLILAFNSGKLFYVDPLLQQDKFLAVDGQVRELALMLLIARNFYNKDIIRKKVLDILTEIEENSKYVRNRIVAANFKRKLLKLSYGSKAPGILLINAEGKLTGLDEFKGKFVLLDFITSGCKMCLHDFSKLAEIQNFLNKPVEIVVVVTDGKIENVLASVSGAHFHVFRLGRKIQTLEEYEIRIYPTYIIINPDGTVAMAPAPLPNENLDVFLNGFMKRYAKENNK
jgi:thiol-disulfide isomerase/thioredoxin